MDSNELVCSCCLEGYLLGAMFLDVEFIAIYACRNDLRINILLFLVDIAT